MVWDLLQAAGKPVYRTAFTCGSADGNPLFNPFDFQLKNCANTGVLYWGGRLLALYEVRHMLERCVEQFGGLGFCSNKIGAGHLGKGGK